VKVWNECNNWGGVSKARGAQPKGRKADAGVEFLGVGQRVPSPSAIGGLGALQARSGVRPTAFPIFKVL